jgi:undecaprenyl-diphosphatase
MPDWIIAVILGIIEGITEFIPVSSTGHLLIAEHWLGHQSDLYNIVIQCGAVIAVIPLFHQRFHQFIFRWREKATQDYLLKIGVAFFITGAIGFVLDKKGLKLPENLLPVAIAVLVGGVAFLLVEARLRGKQLRDEITWTVAIAVGIGQLLAAVFPGTSRSGATIVLALLLGLNRPLATEFSFLVGIPTMLAAGGLKIFKALHHPPIGAPHEKWSMILLCTVVSAIVSFIAVKWLLRYVQSHTFNVFGWYRIVLGIGIFLFLLASRRSDTSTIQTRQNNQRPHLIASRTVQ